MTTILLPIIRSILKEVINDVPKTACSLSVLQISIYFFCSLLFDSMTVAISFSPLKHTEFNSENSNRKAFSHSLYLSLSHTFDISVVTGKQIFTYRKCNFAYICFSLSVSLSIQMKEVHMNHLLRN